MKRAVIKATDFIDIAEEVAIEIADEMELEGKDREQLLSFCDFYTDHVLERFAELAEAMFAPSKGKAS